MLQELKDCGKSPKSLPKKSPKLKRLKNSRVDQTISIEVFFIKERSGNKINVITKLQYMMSGYG